MVYCSNCGKEDTYEGKYCSKCGNKLENKEKNNNPFPYFAYVIFLERANGHIIGSGFPGYFKYQYEADPNILLEKAIQMDHLTESNLSFRLKQSTVNSLKKILRNHGLKVSGRKKELIKRVKDNLTENEIKDDLSDNYYVLTDEGRSLVHENDHIIYYHKNQKMRDFTLEEYDELIRKHGIKDPNLKYDVALNLLDKYGTKEREKGNWGLYRNSLMSNASIYEEKKEYLKSLEYYLKVIHLDLSGWNNNNMFIPDLIFIVVLPIDDLISKLDLDENELEKKYYSCAKELNLPKTAFTKEESFKYLIQAMRGDLEGVDSIIKNKTSKMKSSLKPLNNL